MARRAPKTTTYKSSLADAVSTACGDLTSLAEECREVVDGAEGGRANTQRILTLGETADTLENISEPEIEDEPGKIEIEYAQMLPKSKRHGLSRGDRRDNATMILDACIQELEEAQDKLEDKEAYQPLIDELNEIKDNAESVEFPGMYG